MNKNDIVKITEEQQVELNINQNMLIMIDQINLIVFSALLTDNEKIRQLQHIFKNLGVEDNEFQVTISKK